MKHIFTAILLFVSMYIFAQQFPEKQPELLKGHTVAIKPLNESQLKYDEGYRNFYSDELAKKTYADNGRQITKPAALEGRVFIVKDVITEKVYTGSFVKLVLADSKGETLYFKIEAGSGVYCFTYPDFKLPADYYCSYIKQEPNPLLDNSKEYFADQRFSYKILKVITEKAAIYRLTIENNIDVPITGLGVTLTLENDQKLVFPKTLIENTKRSHYVASFYLSDEQMKLIAQYKIKTYKFAAHESKMLYGEEIKGIAGCLITRK